MIPHLKSSLISLFLCLFIFQNLHSQVLKNVNLDLNPGGAIYDVAYDSYLDAYIVVGDFTMIQGSSDFQNIAFLDAETFGLIQPSEHPVIVVDGPIYTVEVHKREPETTCDPFCYTSPGLYSVFIGGDFNQVDGQVRIKLAKLGFSFTSSPPADGNSYQLLNWDAEILNDDPSNDPSFCQVNDIHIVGDTMVVTGDFWIDQPSYDANISRENIIAFNAAYTSEGYVSLFTDTGSDYSLDPTISNIISTSMMGSIIYREGFYYFTALGGGTSGNFFSYEVSNGVVNLFVSDNCGTGFNILENTISYYDGQNPRFYVLQDDCSGSTPYSRVFDLQGNQLLNTNGEWIGLNFINAYKNFIYTVTGNSSISQDITTYERINNFVSPILVTSFNHTGQGDGASFFDWLPDNSSQKTWQPKKLHVEQDKLFFTGNYITNVDGQNRQGLAVFCLEPRDAQPFTVADTTICAGNERIYTIPQVEYATGYKWTYTGDGAEIKTSSSSYQSLPSNTPVYFSDLTANSVQIRFGTGTTNGVLTVEPYSICNTQSDYQTSKGQSINLTLAPLPNMSIIADTLAFTCLNPDSLNLEMEVTATNYSFSWTKGGSLYVISTDSLITIYNDGGSTDSSYNAPIDFIGTVTEPINGCASTDTIHVTNDLDGPAFTQNDLSSTPSVFDCSTNQMTFSANIPGADIQWGLTDSTTFANNTFTIYSYHPDTLSFYAHATDTINGCKTTQEYGYTYNNTTLTPQYDDYLNDTTVVLDSVKCTSQLMVAASLPSVSSSTPGDSISWIYNGNYIGDTLILNMSDSVNMLVPNNTKTYQIMTYSDSSKCIDTSEIIVHFDNVEPYIQDYLNPPMLNCSADTVLLVHPGPPDSDEIKGWLDATNTNTLSDSLMVSNTGLYYYESTFIRNGCKIYDTVEVFESNQLLLNSTSDTTICIGDAINISTSPINYSDPVTYNWSSGETTQTISAVGGVDDTLAVSVNSNDGCIGFDTVFVNVNPEMNASFTTIASCIDGSASIVVDTITGGAGSYSYSLDGQNFNGSGTFTNLNFGMYQVTVQDGMGCEKAFNVEIDNSAQAPDLNFLIPTYNQAGDTIVAVNISNFNGFDSLYWDLPGNSNVISVSDSMLVFSIYDEDWYDIGLVAYQDTCSYRFEKSVYFGPYKPSFDQGADTLGITSLTIYPNPTNGQFTVDLSFGVPQQYSVIITNSNGQVIPQMSVSGNDEVINESFTFPTGTPTGAYNINIISEHDARNNPIILN